jgi:hypothetical protein
MNVRNHRGSCGRDGCFLDEFATASLNHDLGEAPGVGDRY